MEAPSLRAGSVAGATMPASSARRGTRRAFCVGSRDILLWFAAVVKHSQQHSLTMNGKHHFQCGVEDNPGAVDNLPDATRAAVFIDETNRPMWELSIRKFCRV